MQRLKSTVLCAVFAVIVVCLGYPRSVCGFTPVAHDLLVTLRAKVAQYEAQAKLDPSTTIDAALALDEQPLARVIRQARDGQAAAQVELGIRVEEGRDTRKDKKEALIWFSRAANQGYAQGQYRLARLLAAQRRPRKTVESYAWAYLAALNHDADGQTTTEAVLLRDKLARTMSPKTMLRGRKTAAGFADNIQPQRSTVATALACTAAPADYVIGEQLRLALANIRSQQRSCKHVGQICPESQKTPETTLAVSRADSGTISAVSTIAEQGTQGTTTSADTDTYTTYDAVCSEDLAMLDSHLQKESDVRARRLTLSLSDHGPTQYTAHISPQEQPQAQPQPQPDRAAMLREYRAIIADNVRPREMPTTGQHPADHADQQPATTTTYTGMEETLERLHALKRLREENERRLGITQHETLLPQELRDRADQLPDIISDDEFNKQIQGFDIRTPHDYRIEIY